MSQRAGRQPDSRFVFPGPELEYNGVDLAIGSGVQFHEALGRPPGQRESVITHGHKPEQRLSRDAEG
jgi:hypothetical protein